MTELHIFFCVLMGFVSGFLMGVAYVVYRREDE